MNKLSLFIASALILVGCAPPPVSISTSITPSPTLMETPSANVAPLVETPTAKAAPLMEEWKPIEILAAEDNPILQDNSTNDWIGTILTEDVRFSSGLQIKFNLETKGTTGIILTATPPGDPWWNGHKRLEIMMDDTSLVVLLRDGTQEQQAYERRVFLGLSNSAGNIREIVVAFDPQVKNIQIQHGNQIIMRISTPTVGDFPDGLFPNGRILEVEFSNSPNSSGNLTLLEFLVPNSDYASAIPTNVAIVGLPGPEIPRGLGVNIHFLSAGFEELELLTETGLKFVRAGFTWEIVESSKGEYDFTPYDSFVRLMHKQGIQIIFILAYGNPLYDEGLAPYTDEGRSAFAQFAAAAAGRYAGQGIIWEIWNEPNLYHFWKPVSNVQDYADLAKTTIKEIRQADSSAFIVGPAVCCFGEPSSWMFMEHLGKLGVLSEFDAITIHPYSLDSPELAEKDYARLREILDKYSPGRKLPIYVGEWGYSNIWANQSELRQAEYLARAWLVNLSNDVNLSIWYDWKNDCLNTGNAECFFGMVDFDLRPKPAYLAAKTLIRTLDGYQFQQRMPTQNSKDYLLLFSKGNNVILAAWTTSLNHAISLPFPGNELTVISLLGESHTLTAIQGQITVDLTSSPRYFLLGHQMHP